MTSKYRDNRPGVLYTRNFILRSLCGIYLMAFVSFYHQSEGTWLTRMDSSRLRGRKGTYGKGSFKKGYFVLQYNP